MTSSRRCSPPISTTDAMLEIRQSSPTSVPKQGWTGDASTMLASDEGLAEVNGALERAAKLQVSGVPTVLVDGVALFSGAIRSELMETHLRRAAGHARI